MPIILLYSSEKDPITHYILTNKDRLNYPLIDLCLKDFVDKVAIFDSIDNFQSKINWNFENKKITNTSQFKIINRLVSLPLNIFENFDDKDKEFSQSELKAYFQFALHSFKNITSLPGQNSLCEDKFSLPEQWLKINNSILNLHTPDFYLGESKYIPKEFKKGTIISTCQYDYYYWKEESFIDSSKSFFMLRPPGIPIITLHVNGLFYFFSPNQNHILEEKKISILKELTLSISLIFKYYFCEILFFIDNKKITFGTISNIPYSSSKKNEFNLIMGKWLKNYVYT